MSVWPLSDNRQMLALRSALLRGASGGVVAAMLAAAPAHAQLRSINAALGRAITTPATAAAQAGVITPAVTGTMKEIMARHDTYQARITQQSNIVAQANAAARGAAQATTQTVHNGLGAGGLVPVSNPTTQSGSTGLQIWTGADQPTQAQTGNTVNVTVNQTESRALLSWESFNVGRDTTLTFNQKGNTDWVVVNRVVGSINPVTGRIDSSLTPAPSQILGSIKADGTVYILNRSGILFGATSQVNLHSLVASSLELGAPTVRIAGATALSPLSLADRNSAYLLNGILPGDVSGLLGSVVGETHEAVTVDQGAQINATGGFVILAAPKVSSAGQISAGLGGQVSLAAGTQIDAYSSTGSSDSIDPNVRGLVLASTGGGTVDVTGSISAPQGYISLSTDQKGSVSLGGILTATTGVSRNGKVSLIGGTVSLAPNAVIAISPDSSTDTIPQSPDALAAFKTSQIDIGAHAIGVDSTTGRLTSVLTDSSGATSPITDLLPSNITLGAGSLIQAPSGDVNIGGTANGKAYFEGDTSIAVAKISIGDNAIIDVSGVADFLVDATRNQLLLSPAKGNELRDTPTYRSATTDGSFTLNGATLYLDPRISGVREDGVAWTGSPLVEAKSLEQQIGITAPELMTSGGNITIKTPQLFNQPLSGATVSSVSIAQSAVLDFAGGWIRYQDGLIRSTKLVTADGRLVDISAADPNESYVAVANGFIENLPQLSDSRVYNGVLANPAVFVAGYSEGRDAGSLTIVAPTVALDATLHGEAIAGAQQVSDAKAASGTSALAGDIRHVQAANGELAAGGLLHISAMLGGNIVVGGGSDGLATGTIHLSDSQISSAGLSGLYLQSSGSVSFASGSTVSLADGGAVKIDAGRSIGFNGAISAPAGSITAQTYNFALGSIFTTDDDLLAGTGALSPTVAPGAFDIVVNSSATLSVRGRWVNDALVTDGLFDGGAYTSGGSISLTAAPHIFAFADATRTKAVDLSGSVLVKSGSLLDLSGGGYVSSSGGLSLSGKGGNLSLINQTVYFQLQGVALDDDGRKNGIERFQSDLTSFQLTPVTEVGYSSAIIPDVLNARVELASGTVRAFGFQGGGTFKLVTPDLNFGSSGGTGTAIPLDFLQQTGFGTLDLTAWNSSVIGNVFSNGRVGNTALLSTEQIKIGAGETLNLTQSVLPTILTEEQTAAAQELATGSDISLDAMFAPTNQLGDYYNRAANLVLGGLTELDILGGTITGAPGSTITTPKLYNAGTIAIAGGTITQREIMPASYVSDRPAIGLEQVLDSDGVDRGAGLSVVFGTADANGKYRETELVAAAYQNAAGTLTARDLVSGGKKGNNTDRQIYYLGLLDSDQGIVLANGSVTDLGGASILDPLAPIKVNGTAARIGKILAGGTIEALGRAAPSTSLFDVPALGDSSFTAFQISKFSPFQVQPALQIVAQTGATIDLSGASDTYDLLTSATGRTPTAMWSNGGTLSALGGGDISGATINAAGGAAQAEGGTIEWLNPTLIQNAGVASGSGLSADQIMSSGFDSFVARGKVSTIGDVDLTLDRSFLLRAPDLLAGATTSDENPYYDISFSSTGDLSIAATHIGLLAVNQRPGTLPGLFDGPMGDSRLTLSAQSIDVAGGVGFGTAFDTVTLDAAGDIRLIGVAPANASATPSLSGAIVVAGDLLMRAAQIYATTGTGNLQQAVEGVDSTPTPFTIASVGGFRSGGSLLGKDNATIRFERSTTSTPALPYSAGSYISVIAENIEQAGILRAPLGRIDLGGRTTQIQTGSTFATGGTRSVTLEDGSITSVSANGLAIPYGTTVDLTDYFFTPTVASAIIAPPSAALHLSGDTITTTAGSTIDASGGGAIYAYEFVSGTGGSRDVLSRFNTDALSSNNGYQYADGRQVYAILPVNSATVALYDPIYSSDYASLYGSDAGKTVHLEAAPGLAAGDYLLLPAKYALLPGAMRLVENVGATSLANSAATTLLDGSIVVGGTYGVAGTSYRESTQRSFTIQSQAVLKSYSRIEQTDAGSTFATRAQQAGLVAPRLPNDAARIVIDPGSGLTIGNRFDTTARNSGRGSQVDIVGDIIRVVSPGTAASGSGVTLLTSDLDNLNAASLLIGGERTDNSDGTTHIAVKAQEIHIANDAANPLTAPEILLAVVGASSLLDIADGASIVASGTLQDTRSGDYDLTVAEGTQTRGTIGSFLRVANGTERFANRVGDLDPADGKDLAKFTIGQAGISGQSLLLDTSRNLAMDTANLQVQNLALSSDTISFSSRSYAVQGLVISPELEAALKSVARITLLSPNVIGFTPGAHSFNDLSINAPGIRAVNPKVGKQGDPIDVTIQAGDFSIRNSFADLGDCRVQGALACNANGNSLSISATTMHFGAGTVRTVYGFDNNISLSASAGAYYSGEGIFDTGASQFNFTTPFLVDLGTTAMPVAGKSPVNYTFAGTGPLTLAAPVGVSVGAPSTPLAPGARLAFGSLADPAQSVSINDVLLRATAGTIDIKSQGNIVLSGATTLATPSYSQSFGDTADSVTVSAGGGAIMLVSKTGDIDVSSAARFTIGGATGKAGAISLLASQGSVTLADQNANIVATAPNAGASFTLDSGTSAFDFAAFTSQFGSMFTGDIAVRTAVGDLALNAGQSLKLSSLSLTSDGGSVLFGGKVDTSGVNGGDISLYARDNVTVAGTATLDAHSDGYADTDTRKASAGDIILGAGDAGAISVASGAVIDLGARRTGNRLVPHTQIDPRTNTPITAYTFVEADQGGTLTLRAPVIAQPGADIVNVQFAGRITGARDVTVEGYRAYDLANIAANSAFTGVSLGGNTATLDVGAATAGKANFLSDNAAGTIVDFIQKFDISATRANLGEITSLAAYHERPGVELRYSGNILLASNWNLGAGSVDVAAAVAAGDMQLSALGPRADASPRYEVVPGHEAHLFQNFVTMLYRVGGTVNGAAGNLTLRSGGNLDIEHSITDGFFAFSDQTDPDYLDFQLGGGTRYYQPSIAIRCGANDCSALADYAPDTRKNPQLPPIVTSIGLTLTQISVGEQLFPLTNAPYSASANSAAATGLGTGGSGDPIGSAQIFPLLGDGSAAESFSIRLVGGAGDSPSANPLHVDRASDGSVIVAGETRYALDSTKSVGQYSGSAELNFGASGQFLSDDILTSFSANSGVDAATLANKSTRVQFGTVSIEAAAYMRAAALAFFADYPDQVQFVGPVAARTGFSAPFALVAKFLESTDSSGQTILQRYGAMISNGTFAYKAPTSTGTRLDPGGDAVTRTLVRTGTGTIDLAAAADIDMRNGDTVNLRTKTNAKNGNVREQVGGTAVYTVGHVLNPVAVSARVVGTSEVRTIDPTAYLPASDLRSQLWEPTTAGRLQVNPVFATGGGSISLVAGNDILSRRDLWSELFNGNDLPGNLIKKYSAQPAGADMVGSSDQRWRVGQIGQDDPLNSYIRINPQQFSSGVGTLGGGDIRIAAGGDVTELTTALDTTIVTGTVDSSFGEMRFGGGNLDIYVGGNINGGQFDISTGVANITARGNIGASPTLASHALPEIRLTDTVLNVQAGGTVTLGNVTALGVDSADNVNSQTKIIVPTVDANAFGYYTGTSAIHILASGTVAIGDAPAILGPQTDPANVLPATLDVTSFGGNIDLGGPAKATILYPGADGQLSLLAGGTLHAVAIDLEDSSPSLLPGIFSANKYDPSDRKKVLFGRYFALPAVLPNSSDATRRLFHNSTPTHIADTTPARIAVGGNLDNLTLYLAKAARISAGQDIVNMVFVGQNLTADDTTRIVAGRDITATSTRTAQNAIYAPGKLVNQGNVFILGGPGALFVEAGRNLGPFLNSAMIDNVTVGVGDAAFARGTSSYAGGILAVGNDYNPWLAPKSADIFAFFGVGKGMDFDSLRDTYVDPANTGALDGDIFAQNVDSFGNKTPDRTRPIYSPILISWMQANQAGALLSAFGTTDVTAAQAYSLFITLPNLVQRRFLLDKVYFNELAETSRPDGNSYLQYIRGYRAVDTLFPAALGYTANDLTGTSNGGTKVQTGNLDLRLAAIETTRGSNVTILGPGGNAILGSVVRTSTQATGRAYQPQIFGTFATSSRPLANSVNFQVRAIPLGYEGVLTLRGGTIHGFTDGDLRLNQSRLFTQQSGDITLWSSNGDLNAGQGPKNAANVPSIVLRFNPNGGSEVDAAGGVVGAGIAGFSGIRRLNAATGTYDLIDVQNDPDVATAEAQLKALPRGANVVVNGKTYTRDLPTITLIAPVGTVDAGDAGVRASGDIFVAAAQIANADNFKVGGASIGIPSIGPTAAPALPAGAAAAVTANLFRANSSDRGDQLSRITVDVLGAYSANPDDCKDAQGNMLPDCNPPPSTN